MKRAILLAFAILSLLSDSSFGCQDAVDAGQQELNKRNFPWYEKETGKVVEVNRKKNSQAKSLDRGDISTRRIKQRAAANAPMNTNWGAGLSGFMWVMIALAGLAIAALIIWVFLQMESKQGTSVDAYLDEQEDMQQRIKQLPFQIEQNHKGDFRSMASAAAKSDEFGRAMMLLFSHVLLTLDKKKLIKLKRGKTNRQYLNELKPHQPLKQFYEKIMVPFEDNFFGSHEIAQPVFEECWRELDSFHSNVAISSEVLEGGAA